jgi:MFS transporter, DHA1 family, multidrug resistance protein
MEFAHPAIMSFQSKPGLSFVTLSPLVHVVSLSAYLSPVRLSFAVHMLTRTFQWTLSLELVDKKSQSMYDIIREAPLGQLIRWVTRNRVLKYLEEETNFIYPPGDLSPSEVDSLSSNNIEKHSEVKPADDPNDGGLEEAVNPQTLPSPFLTRNATSSSSTIDRATTRPDIEGNKLRSSLTRTRTRETTTAHTLERLELENEEKLQRLQSTPIQPQMTSSGEILVDWYTTDDPANPQNWSSAKKVFVGMQIL